MRFCPGGSNLKEICFSNRDGGNDHDVSLLLDTVRHWYVYELIGEETTYA